MPRKQESLWPHQEQFLSKVLLKKEILITKPRLPKSCLNTTGISLLKKCSHTNNSNQMSGASIVLLFFSSFRSLNVIVQKQFFTPVELLPRALLNYCIHTL